MSQQQLTEELSKINALLRDPEFAATVAAAQEKSYYTTLGQQPPPFFTGPDKLIKKSYKEEKIATNLAGFYAVICGIGTLALQKGQTPVYWLQQIADKTLEAGDALLLHRFANATWKAGQPFRSLDRITRENFIVANFLGGKEIQKDATQVETAANLLLYSLHSVHHGTRQQQLGRICDLLQDKEYALEMAQHLEAAYYTGQDQDAPPFLTPEQENATIDKSAREEKIAINIAGLYALECGISYLAATQHQLPSLTLQAILTDSLDQKDKQLFERFANATWKAGQPFRSLDRITRPVFMPFDLLSEEEVQKDWVQIKSAAKKLSGALQ